MELHESDGLGLLIVRDEIAGLLQAVEADSKRGRNTGEAQLLELFDGTGTLLSTLIFQAQRFLDVYGTKTITAKRCAADRYPDWPCLR